MTIETLSVAELVKLEKEIEKRKAALEKERLSEAAGKINAVLADHGVSLDEIMPFLAKKGGAQRKRGSVPPKYRNPKDKTQTWTGRGRKPLWVVAALDAGQSLDDLRI